ncbi:MAG: hypothetical protein H6895_12425 [Defluviimonas sp.]|uniref:hypothetical protein n=1 Tax=Albidovulum sp. TaxID=1872424 RepID=UPI001DA01931|nr:hypothetical protein [Paracoccaceae bacterium]MCC0064876.1 hypothetical protein [Defluviimonas sp.]
MDGIGAWKQARGPRGYLALGSAMMLVYLAVVLEMGLLVKALAVAYLALVLLRIVINPGRGFRFGPDSVHWFARRGAGAAPISAIRRVSIGRDIDGRTVCVMSLSDGRDVPLSGVEEVDPARLMREFGRRGVPIMGGTLGT